MAREWSEGRTAVKLLSEAQSENCLFVRREFEVTVGGLTRKLDHFHFKGWEDFSTPCGAGLAGYESLINDNADFVREQFYKENAADKQKLLVHCRDGMGRTGTTLALTNLAITLREQGSVDDPQINVVSVVRRLRE